MSCIEKCKCIVFTQMDGEFKQILKKENLQFDKHFSQYGDEPDVGAVGLLAMADPSFPDLAVSFLQ